MRRVMIPSLHRMDKYDIYTHSRITASFCPVLKRDMRKTTRPYAISRSVIRKFESVGQPSLPCLSQGGGSTNQRAKEPSYFSIRPKGEETMADNHNERVCLAGSCTSLRSRSANQNIYYCSSILICQFVLGQARRQGGKFEYCRHRPP
jgi:hypothetical protein